MATTSEKPFTCADCGIEGKDRPKNEINYLFTEKVNGNTYWRCRCKSCYWKWRRSNAT